MEEFSASVSLGAKLFIKTKSERGKFALVFSDPNNIKNIVTIYQKPNIKYTIPFLLN
jgi:hypothetical protein